MTAAWKQRFAIGVMSAALGLTAGCDGPAQPDAAASAQDGETTNAPETKPAGGSIFREDIEGARKPAILENRVQTVRFAQGGAALDQRAIDSLSALLKAPHIDAGSAIILRAHSDAAGSDTANMRASEERGQTVKGWLVKQGIDAARIRVIAFGEQNPVQPNALPNGAPNEEGRAANRRVEITLMGSDAETGALPASEGVAQSEG